MQHRLVTAAGPAWLRPAPALYVSVAAWSILLLLSVSGAGTIIRHDRLLQGGPPLWLATLLFAGGWLVMVAAMMFPASLGAFARMPTRRTLADFALGYLAVWTGFGLAIFLADAGVHDLVNHWSWLASHAWVIAGTALVAAGTYQLTGLKSRSLEACRVCPSRNGAVHGLQCIGSSGGLMFLAFALAAANLFTMAAFTALMLIETSRIGHAVVKPVGYALIALGVFVLYGPIQI